MCKAVLPNSRMDCQSHGSFSVHVSCLLRCSVQQSVARCASMLFTLFPQLKDTASFQGFIADCATFGNPVCCVTTRFTFYLLLPWTTVIPWWVMSQVLNALLLCIWLSMLVFVLLPLMLFERWSFQVSQIVTLVSVIPSTSSAMLQWIQMLWTLSW